MEPDHRNKKGNEQPKRKAVKAKQTHFSLGKFGDILARIGEWSAGVAAIVALIVWLFMHPVWAFWTVLIAVPVGVGFAAFRFRKYHPGTRIAWAVTAIAASSGIAFWLPAKPRTESHEFSVVCKCRIDKWVYLLCYGKKPEESTVAPFPTVIDVNFTNLKLISMMIDSYSVESQDASGKWIPMRVSDERWWPDGECFMANPGDFQHGREVYIKQSGFHYLLVNKNVSPGETVRGWLFFDNQPPSEKLRIKIRDASGSESVCTFRTGPAYSPPVLNEPQPASEAAEPLANLIQWTAIKVGDIKDYSSYRIVR